MRPLGDTPCDRLRASRSDDAQDHEKIRTREAIVYLLFSCARRAPTTRARQSPQEDSDAHDRASHARPVAGWLGGGPLFVVMPCTAVLKHKEKGPVAGWVAGGPARPRYVGAASTSGASGARAAAVNVRTQEAIEVLDVGGPSRSC